MDTSEMVIGVQNIEAEKRIVDIKDIPEPLREVVMSQKDEVIKFLMAGKGINSDVSKMDKFMAEIFRDIRQERYTPSKEDIYKMDELDLQRNTIRTLKELLSSYCFDLHGKLEKMSGGWGDYVEDLLSKLWISRQNPDDITLIDKSSLEEAKTKLDELRRPWPKMERYKKLHEILISKRSFKGQQSHEYSQLAKEKENWEWEQKNCRNEKDRLVKYLKEGDLQKDLQTSLAYELRRMSGGDFGLVFADAVVHGVLAGRNKMRWNGAEEAFLEIDEVLNRWFDKYNEDVPLDRPIVVSNEAVANSLRDKFWDRVTSAHYNWNEWSEEDQEIFQRELLVFLRVLNKQIVT